MSQKLTRLINGYPLVNMVDTLERDIASIAYDSRKVEPGGLFVAIPGHRHDGSWFIADAIEKQAAAYITEASVEEIMGMTIADGNVTGIHVEDSRHALAWVAARFFGEPSKSMELVGITGTNGKTTLTYLMESIYRAHNQPCGVIGSIDYRFAGQSRKAPMTTPEALEINSMLAEMRAQGISKCVVEVSSHSLALKRVRELHFAIAVFTNLTRDHLDFHNSIEHYKESKKGLFRDCSVRHQVINVDDPVGLEIRAEFSLPTLTVGLDQPADITAEDIVLSEQGVRFTAKTPGGSCAMESALLGRHNTYNLLTAVAVATLQGIPLSTIAQGIEALRTVPGRFEKVEQGQDFIVAVDYAHTDDALKNALNAARDLAANRVIVVFGAGGDRDPGKRKEMGRVALELSDLAVITSDNPRTEDPEKIIRDICEGIPSSAREGEQFVLLPSRREAIQFAVQQAATGDLVLIAGKGHEDYQILSGGTIHFDDREEAQWALQKKQEAHGQ